MGAKYPSNMNLKANFFLALGLCALTFMMGAKTHPTPIYGSFHMWPPIKEFSTHSHLEAMECAVPLFQALGPSSDHPPTFSPKLY